MVRTKARDRASKLVRVIAKYRIPFGVVTVLLYVAAVPITIIVFPNNSMWLGLLVLFTGLTASLATLADLLMSSEDD